MRKLRAKAYATLLSVLVILTSFSLTAAAESLEPLPEVPVKGMVTMLDLGAHKCIPCKMMAPIIEQLKKEYDGRAAILFIDVWQNPNEARKYGIQAIPTQIFYDNRGNEVFRHQGFLDKKRIVKLLEKLGVK